MKEFQEKISTVSFWVVLGIGVIALAGWFIKELSLAGMGKTRFQWLLQLFLLYPYQFFSTQTETKPYQS